MSELDVKAAKLWNEVTDGLLAAKEAWEKLGKEIGMTDPGDFVELDPKAVKLISVYRKAKFEVFVPRFISFYRGQGGLEAMRVAVPKVVIKTRKTKGDK